MPSRRRRGARPEAAAESGPQWPELIDIRPKVAPVSRSVKFTVKVRGSGGAAAAPAADGAPGGEGGAGAAAAPCRTVELVFRGDALPRRRAAQLSGAPPDPSGAHPREAVVRAQLDASGCAEVEGPAATRAGVVSVHVAVPPEAADAGGVSKPLAVTYFDAKLLGLQPRRVPRGVPVQLSVRGTGFAPSVAVVVRFITSSDTIDVPGRYVTSSSISCMVPMPPSREVAAMRVAVSLNDGQHFTKMEGSKLQLCHLSSIDRTLMAESGGLRLTFSGVNLGSNGFDDAGAIRTFEEREGTKPLAPVVRFLRGPLFVDVKGMFSPDGSSVFCTAPSLELGKPSAAEDDAGHDSDSVGADAVDGGAVVAGAPLAAVAEKRHERGRASSSGTAGRNEIWRGTTAGGGGDATQGKGDRSSAALIDTVGAEPEEPPFGEDSDDAVIVELSFDGLHFTRTMFRGETLTSRQLRGVSVASSPAEVTPLRVYHVGYIASAHPPGCTTRGGCEVVIRADPESRGFSLTDAAHVRFNSLASASTTVVVKANVFDSHTIKCIAPGGAAAGVYTVDVSLNGLQWSTSFRPFVFYEPPMLTECSPSHSVVQRETQLTVTLRGAVDLGHSKFHLVGGGEVSEVAVTLPETVSLRSKIDLAMRAIDSQIATMGRTAAAKPFRDTDKAPGWRQKCVSVFRSLQDDCSGVLRAKQVTRTTVDFPPRALAGRTVVQLSVNGGSASEVANPMTHTFLAPCVTTSLSLHCGPVTGGTPLELRGRGFRGGTGHCEVRFMSLKPQRARRKSSTAAADEGEAEVPVGLVELGRAEGRVNDGKVEVTTPPVLTAGLSWVEVSIVRGSYSRAPVPFAFYEPPTPSSVALWPPVCTVGNDARILVTGRLSEPQARLVRDSCAAHAAAEPEQPKSPSSDASGSSSSSASGPRSSRSRLGADGALLRRVGAHGMKTSVGVGLEQGVQPRLHPQLPGADKMSEMVAALAGDSEKRRARVKRVALRLRRGSTEVGSTPQPRRRSADARVDASAAEVPQRPRSSTRRRRDSGSGIGRLLDSVLLSKAGKKAVQKEAAALKNAASLAEATRGEWSLRKEWELIFACPSLRGLDGPDDEVKAFRSGNWRTVVADSVDGKQLIEDTGCDWFFPPLPDGSVEAAAASFGRASVLLRYVGPLPGEEEDPAGGDEAQVDDDEAQDGAAAVVRGDHSPAFQPMWIWSPHLRRCRREVADLLRQVQGLDSAIAKRKQHLDALVTDGLGAARRKPLSSRGRQLRRAKDDMAAGAGAELGAAELANTMRLIHQFQGHGFAAPSSVSIESARSPAGAQRGKHRRPRSATGSREDHGAAVSPVDGAEAYQSVSTVRLHGPITAARLYGHGPEPKEPLSASIVEDHEQARDVPSLLFQTTPLSRTGRYEVLISYNGVDTHPVGFVTCAPKPVIRRAVPPGNYVERVVIETEATVDRSAGLWLRFLRSRPVPPTATGPGYLMAPVAAPTRNCSVRAFDRPVDDGRSGLTVDLPREVKPGQRVTLGASVDGGQHFFALLEQLVCTRPPVLHHTEPGVAHSGGGARVSIVGSGIEWIVRRHFGGATEGHPCSVRLCYRHKKGSKARKWFAGDDLSAIVPGVCSHDGELTFFVPKLEGSSDGSNESDAPTSGRQRSNSISDEVSDGGKRPMLSLLRNTLRSFGGSRSRATGASFESEGATTRRQSVKSRGGDEGAAEGRTGARTAPRRRHSDAHVPQAKASPSTDTGGQRRNLTSRPRSAAAQRQHVLPFNVEVRLFPDDPWLPVESPLHVYHKVPTLHSVHPREGQAEESFWVWLSASDVAKSTDAAVRIRMGKAEYLRKPAALERAPGSQHHAIRVKIPTLHKEGNCELAYTLDGVQWSNTVYMRISAMWRGAVPAQGSTASAAGARRRRRSSGKPGYQPEGRQSPTGSVASSTGGVGASSVASGSQRSVSPTPSGLASSPVATEDLDGDDGRVVDGALSRLSRHSAARTRASRSNSRVSGEDAPASAPPQLPKGSGVAGLYGPLSHGKPTRATVRASLEREVRLHRERHAQMLKSDSMARLKDAESFKSLDDGDAARRLEFTLSAIEAARTTAEPPSLMGTSSVRARVAAVAASVDAMFADRREQHDKARAVDAPKLMRQPHQSPGTFDVADDLGQYDSATSAKAARELVRLAREAGRPVGDDEHQLYVPVRENVHGHAPRKSVVAVTYQPTVQRSYAKPHYDGGGAEPYRGSRAPFASSERRFANPFAHAPQPSTEPHVGPGSFDTDAKPEAPYGQPAYTAAFAPDFRRDAEGNDVPGPGEYDVPSFLDDVARRRPQVTSTSPRFTDPSTWGGAGPGAGSAAASSAEAKRLQKLGEDLLLSIARPHAPSAAPRPSAVFASAVPRFSERQREEMMLAGAYTGPADGDNDGDDDYQHARAPTAPAAAVFASAVPRFGLDPAAAASNNDKEARPEPGTYDVGGGMAPKAIMEGRQFASSAFRNTGREYDSKLEERRAREVPGVGTYGDDELPSPRELARKGTKQKGRRRGGVMHSTTKRDWVAEATATALPTAPGMYDAHRSDFELSVEEQVRARHSAVFLSPGRDFDAGGTPSATDVRARGAQSTRPERDARGRSPPKTRRKGPPDGGDDGDGLDGVDEWDDMFDVEDDAGGDEGAAPAATDPAPRSRWSREPTRSERPRRQRARAAASVPRVAALPRSPVVTQRHAAAAASTSPRPRELPPGTKVVKQPAPPDQRKSLLPARSPRVARALAVVDTPDAGASTMASPLGALRKWSSEEEFGPGAAASRARARAASSRTSSAAAAAGDGGQSPTARARRTKPSAVFASRLPGTESVEDYDPRAANPGPGAYEPDAPPSRPPRQLTGFGSTTRRLYDDGGPGSVSAIARRAPRAATEGQGLARPLPLPLPMGRAVNSGVEAAQQPPAEARDAALGGGRARASATEFATAQRRAPDEWPPPPSRLQKATAAAPRVSLTDRFGDPVVALVDRETPGPGEYGTTQPPPHKPGVIQANAALTPAGALMGPHAAPRHVSPRKGAHRPYFDATAEDLTTARHAVALAQAEQRVAAGAHATAHRSLLKRL